MKISNAKKCLSMLLAVIMLLSCFAVSAYAIDMSSFIAVSDKYEFAAIANNPNGKYYLADDIVFTEDDFRSGGEFFNKGKYFIAMDVFKGVIDGCGHSITGLKGNCAITEDNKGTIKNLCIESSVFTDSAICNTNNNEIINCIVKNCTAPYIVNTNSSTISYCFGVDNNYNGICFYNNGDMLYCINDSDITVELKAYVGGIAGYNDYGSISYCINLGDITADANGTGGICGSAGHSYSSDDGSISYCANYGDINAGHSGGICYQSTAIVDNCINYGKLISNYYSAGIILSGEALCCVNLGKVNSGNEISFPGGETTECYDSSNISDIGQQGSYPALNFTKDWQIKDGKPVLRMENKRIIGSSIYSLPKKTLYEIGDSFDETGLVVITYNNKGEWVNTDNYTVSGYNSQFGKKTIKVKCNGFENSFTVLVRDNIANCTVNPIEAVTETGKAIEVIPTVISSRGEKLKYGTDFTLGYENNIKPGFATVYIIGQGLYYGLTETSFEIKKGINFPDVRKGDWFYDVVKYNAQKGFITGYSSGKFGPNDALKRQDFVCILARIDGADLSKYANQTSKLKDVKKGDYYAAAVNWAVDKGYISGYKNGKFGVNDPITREQVATILYNYMGQPKVANAKAILSKFPDANRVSSFAVTPVAWAVDKGIISGMGNGTVASTSGATRAQIAAIIQRMDTQGMFD